MWYRTVLTAASMLVAILLVACGSSGLPDVPDVATEPTAISGGTPTPITHIPDGTYEVGTAGGRVSPGTYKTTVPAKSIGCYWERMRALDGGLKNIIANDNGDAGQPMIVVISASDAGFKTRGCGTWIRQ